jgi:hypothetical protein
MGMMYVHVVSGTVCSGRQGCVYAWGGGVCGVLWAGKREHRAAAWHPIPTATKRERERAHTTRTGLARVKRRHAPEEEVQPPLHLAGHQDLHVCGRPVVFVVVRVGGGLMSERSIMTMTRREREAAARLGYSTAILLLRREEEAAPALEPYTHRDACDPSCSCRRRLVSVLL